MDLQSPYNTSSTRENSQRSNSTTPIESSRPGHVKLESRSAAEERRARKREQDRLCQRRKREKDRENLRRLEARLDGLQNADESKTVLDLILRHEQDQAKIDRQVARLRQLQSLLQTGLSDLAKDAAATTASHTNEEWQTQDSEESGGDAPIIPAPSAAPASIKRTVHHSAAIAQPIASSVNLTTAMYGATTSSYNNFSEPNTYGPVTFTAMALSQAYSQMDSSITPNTPWIMAGNILQDTFRKVQRFGNNVTTTDSLDQHIILLVCLHGWDHAAVVVGLTHPLWACLRQVDEALLRTWKQIERLVALYVVWRGIKANAQGPEAVAQITPKFFRPRPSQMSVPHRPDIDYIPWPGMRERLVFHSDRYYCHDGFLRMFSSCNRFLWQGSVTDTFFENKETGLCQFTPDFIKRFNNVNCWTMDAAFFNEYPEFIGDIPMSNSIPPHVVDKVDGGQDYYFQGTADIHSADFNGGAGFYNSSVATLGSV